VRAERAAPFDQHAGRAVADRRLVTVTCPSLDADKHGQTRIKELASAFAPPGLPES
jgi:hypothetical protein